MKRIIIAALAAIVSTGAAYARSPQDVFTDIRNTAPLTSVVVTTDIAPPAGGSDFGP